MYFGNFQRPTTRCEDEGFFGSSCAPPRVGRGAGATRCFKFCILVEARDGGWKESLGANYCRTIAGCAAERVKKTAVKF